MKKIIIVSLLFLFISAGLSAQIFMTRTGQVSFFSKTSVENIDAVNNEATSLLNSTTGEMVFAVLIKSFHFERALMEEHFNENYMESTKYPKATFKGKITNLAKIDFKKDGNYEAVVEGELTLHDVMHKTTTTGTITIANGKVSATATFNIKLADYRVEIPALVADKLSKTVDVKVNCGLIQP